MAPWAWSPSHADCKDQSHSGGPSTASRAGCKLEPPRTESRTPSAASDRRRQQSLSPRSNSFAFHWFSFSSCHRKAPSCSFPRAPHFPPKVLSLSSGALSQGQQAALQPASPRLRTSLQTGPAVRGPAEPEVKGRSALRPGSTAGAEEGRGGGVGGAAEGVARQRPRPRPALGSGPAPRRAPRPAPPGSRM